MGLGATGDGAADAAARSRSLVGHALEGGCSGAATLATPATAIGVGEAEPARLTSGDAAFSGACRATAPIG